MKINHIGIWVKDLENMKLFYEKYFHAQSNEIYVNKKKQFKSYLLTLDDFCKIELMSKEEIVEIPDELFSGYTHIAVSLGSKDEVNALTEQLRKDGYIIASEPRITGDGFYESVIKDPEGNLIELTI